MIGWMTPMILTGLAALAIPVILHLIRKRPQVVIVASLKFVPKGFRSYQKRLRIHELLLLLLRLFFLALIVCAFAHPFLLRGSDSYAREQSRTVYLLDASLSMQARGQNGIPVWQTALGVLRNRLAATPDSADWTVVLFANSVCETLAHTSAWESVIAGWETNYPTYADTDYSRAAAAAAQIAGAVSGTVHVCWLTDLQRPALMSMAPSRLPAWCTVELIPCLPASGDRSFAFARASRSFLSNAVVTLPFSVTPPGPTIADNSLELRLNDTPVSGVTLQPGSVSFPQPQPGIYTVSARYRPNDCLDADNYDSCVLSVTRPWQVLCLSREASRGTLYAETLYLEQALTRMTGTADWNGRPEVITANELNPASLSAFRVICLVNIERLNDEIVQAIQAYVRNGGGLMIFTGDSVDIPWYNSTLLDAGLLPARIEFPTARAVSDHSGFMTVQAWDALHPALSLFGAPGESDLGKQRFYRIMQSSPLTNAQVLARFDNDLPFLVSQQTGSGTVLLVTSTADTAWNDLPRSRLYLPLMRELCRWLARETDIDRAVVRKTISEPGIKPGVSVLSRDPFEAIAWQVSPAECDLSTGSPESLRAKLGVAGEAFSVRAADGKGTEKDDRILSWIVAAALLVCCIEGIYANAVSHV